MLIRAAERGIDSAIIETLEHWVLGTLRPDLVLLLDMPLETSLMRIKNRTKDRFEREDRLFFERVRARYLSRAALSDGRIRVIDADRPLAEVQACIAAHLDEMISR